MKSSRNCGEQSLVLVMLLLQVVQGTSLSMHAMAIILRVYGQHRSQSVTMAAHAGLPQQQPVQADDLAMS